MGRTVADVADEQTRATERMDRARTPLTTAGRQTEVKVTPDPRMASTDGSDQPSGNQKWYLRLAKGGLPYVRDVMLLLCAVAVVLVTRERGPAAPGFFCQDPGITYPFRGDSVSVTVLVLLTVLLPTAVMVSVELVQQRGGLTWGFSRPLWTAAVLSSHHITCQAFLFATTEVIKCMVSRPRPCFLDLCQPTGYNSTLCDNRHFISKFECSTLSTTTSHYEELLIIDSMLSFPSGHAAVSCCTATFMALYLSSRSGGRRRAVLRSWLTFCCVLYGCVISFSRVTDHRHHLTDVLAGMALGTAAGALLSYGVCQSTFNKLNQRKPLLPQSSVASNRTSDTQTTALDDEF